jgi:hypothetical protein
MMAQFGAKMASGWQCDIDSSHTKSTVGRRKIRISLMIPENELPHSLEVTLEFSLMIYLANGAGSGAFQLPLIPIKSSLTAEQEFGNIKPGKPCLDSGFILVLHAMKETQTEARRPVKRVKDLSDDLMLVSSGRMIAPCHQTRH